jgi:hypothetical protein
MMLVLLFGSGTLQMKNRLVRGESVEAHVVSTRRPAAGSTAFHSFIGLGEGLARTAVAHVAVATRNTAAAA